MEHRQCTSCPRSTVATQTEAEVSLHLARHNQPIKRLRELARRYTKTLAPRQANQRQLTKSTIMSYDATILHRKRYRKG